MSETEAARVGDRHDCPKHGGGPIVTGSTNVFVNSTPFAHVADRASCGGPSDYLVTGAAKVTVNGKKASRVTSHCMHGGKVAAGSPNVLVGGPEAGGTLGNPDAAKRACKDLSQGRVKQPGQNPDQQDFSNCGIESSRLLMHQATGSNVGEIPLLDQAIALGDASVHKENGITTSMGGSTLNGQRDLLSKNGVATQSVAATQDNISQAVADGQGVISHHDVGPLWQTTQKGGHAINATGLNYDDNGNLKSVTTVDSGVGSCARDVPAGDYFQSMDVGGFKNAIVTSTPIWK